MSFATQPLKRAISYTSLVFIATVICGCASREERIQEIQAEANAAFFVDDSTTAIEILREGLDKFPDSNELRVTLSRAVQNAGKLEEAATLLEQAIEQDPDADHLWVKIGELRAGLGQSEKAILAFESFLKNHGNDFLAWKGVAIENEKLGKLTDSIKAATRWNEIAPSSQPALMLGQLYLTSGNIPQARSWLGQAAAYEDGYAAKEALAELVRLETSLKQFQQAGTWLNQYTQRYPNDLSDPRIQQSKTVLDNWQRARREIAAAAAELQQERQELESQRPGEQNADAKPQDANLTADLTIPQPKEESSPRTSPKKPTADPVEKAPLALFDDEDPAQNVSETPDEPPPSELNLTQYETAVAAYEAGDYDEAIAIYWELLSENPNDAQVWYHLSQAFAEKGSWYDAESTVLEAKRRAPRSEVIANQYLITIRNTQNINSVLEEIKAMRKLFPRSHAIALTQAQTLRNANAPRSIVSSAYQDFLSIAPRGAPGYQEANRYLQNGN